MNLKANYQYTYFIYPFAINNEKYEKYIESLIKNKKYKIKFFDNFKDVDLYKYFVPNVKEKMFQDFSFNIEKINVFNKLNWSQKFQILKQQNCLIFEYKLENQIQGKIDEKDGIFFDISKIELICFNTGICFLLIKTHLLETDNFSDILNFNYKFENINLENKKLNKIDNIKIQTSAFNNMKKLTEILEDITGKMVESKKIDIDENSFLVYTYACLENNYWNNEDGFESIENEFIKLSEVKPNDANINVDYNKLSLLTDSSYKKIRVSGKGIAAICSSADKDNYTKFPEIYENQYLYTYIIALHQRYYLKKILKELRTNTKLAIKKFIKFNNEIWISEITEDSLGQKLYKRCKEKLNLQDIFNEAKNKYDIYYKEQNIEKNRKTNKVILILLICCLIVGIANIASWLFIKG